jgi:hypothetical protein
MTKWFFIVILVILMTTILISRYEVGYFIASRKYFNECYGSTLLSWFFTYCTLYSIMWLQFLDLPRRNVGLYNLSSSDLSKFLESQETKYLERRNLITKVCKKHENSEIYTLMTDYLSPWTILFNAEEKVAYCVNFKVKNLF